MYLTNLGQLGNPCERAITNCASDNLPLSDNFACAKVTTSRIQPSIRMGSSGIWMPARSTRPFTQFADQFWMASGSGDVAARSSSFASCLYCSRSGRAGRGSAACGLGNIRISFHACLVLSHPVRPVQKTAQERALEKQKNVFPLSHRPGDYGWMFA